MRSKDRSAWSGDILEVLCRLLFLQLEFHRSDERNPGRAGELVVKSDVFEELVADEVWNFDD